MEVKMTKDEKIQIACSTIQSAIILDLFANVTDDTKKLITKQLSDIYKMGYTDGMDVFLEAFHRSRLNQD